MFKIKTKLSILNLISLHSIFILFRFDSALANFAFHEFSYRLEYHGIQHNHNSCLPLKSSAYDPYASPYRLYGIFLKNKTEKTATKLSDSVSIWSSLLLFILSPNSPWDLLAPHFIFVSNSSCHFHFQDDSRDWRLKHTRENGDWARD
jgi:hypothetical protein